MEQFLQCSFIYLLIPLFSVLRKYKSIASITKGKSHEFVKPSSEVDRLKNAVNFKHIT